MRRLLSTTYEIQASVLNHAAAPRDLVEQAERAMLEVAHDDRQKDFRTIDEILDDELKKMEKLSREGTSLTGTPSGFRDLDEITGGFQPGNLIVIAARPSMGKSALVTNIAENAAIDHGAAGRAVLARDVRDGARAALRGVAGAHQGRRAAQGPRARRQVAEDPPGRRRSSPRRRCTSTTPRTSGSSRSARRRGGCTSRSRSGSSSSTTCSSCGPTGASSRASSRSAR